MPNKLNKGINNKYTSKILTLKKVKGGNGKGHIMIIIIPH